MFGVTSVNGRKPIIGLSGGVASGKSAVADMLTDLGAAVIDADQLNDRVLADPDVIAEIRQHWPEAVGTGDNKIDRARLADIVFQDPDQRKKLEALTHPRIAVRWAESLEKLQADPNVRAVVYNAPLLFEAGLKDACDCVIFVEADEAVRIERVVQNRGWTEQELKRRENAQWPLDAKRKKSDYIVNNNSNLEMLRQRVEEIFSRITAMNVNA